MQDPSDTAILNCSMYTAKVVNNEPNGGREETEAPDEIMQEPSDMSQETDNAPGGAKASRDGVDGDDRGPDDTKSVTYISSGEETQPMVTAARTKAVKKRAIEPYPWKWALEDGDPVIELTSSEEDSPPVQNGRSVLEAVDAASQQILKRPVPEGNDDGDDDDDTAAVIAKGSSTRKRFRSLKGNKTVAADIDLTGPPSPQPPSREEASRFFEKAREPDSPNRIANRNGDFLAVVRGKECGILYRPSKPLWNAIMRDRLSASKRFASVDDATTWFKKNMGFA
ncbi:hypothetical protein EVG20_g4644 [Dentipellis fragilis]|uniref:Uncharacterized protein n=1 Tax=Dentipellis fragilis TaxID=205917 RepID=A0A4Y9YV31_9AGAM|nr:hypothetical protein EVG20_g4644 [Dentipellis fragilis]